MQNHTHKYTTIGSHSGRMKSCLMGCTDVQFRDRQTFCMEHISQPGPCFFWFLTWLPLWSHRTGHVPPKRQAVSESQCVNDQGDHTLRTNSMALVRERTIPSNRHLLVKLVPTFADRGCRVVSATDPHGRILGSLDRSRYYFFHVAPQLYSRGWVDPVADPLLARKSALWICSQELWPLDHRGGQP
jgi:hypothetical protein